MVAKFKFFKPWFTVSENIKQHPTTYIVIGGGHDLHDFINYRQAQNVPNKPNYQFFFNFEAVKLEFGSLGLYLGQVGVINLFHQNFRLLWVGNII